MEQSDHYGRATDHAGTSVFTAGLSGQHSLQLEISGIEAEGSVSEEDDEEEELVVLDPEHVSKLDLFFCLSSKILILLPLVSCFVHFDPISL